MEIPNDVYDRALPHRFAKTDDVNAFHVIAEWARKEALQEAADQLSHRADARAMSRGGVVIKQMQRDAKWLRHLAQEAAAA